MRDINVNTVKPEPQKVRVLDLVLRCTPEFRYNYSLPPESELEAGLGKIFERDEWEPCPKQPSDQNFSPTSFPENPFKVIKFEKANERTPQNYFDLSIYTDCNYDFCRF